MTRLTVKEAAEYLVCSVSTLNKLRVRGGGPPYNKRTGKVLYDTADLDRWWSEGKQRSTSERPKRRGRPGRGREAWKMSSDDGWKAKTFSMWQASPPLPRQ